MGRTDDPDEPWVDEGAGPVLRPFAVARGRTRRTGTEFDLIAMIVTAEVPVPDPRTLGPEEEHILERCLRPRSVAELAADLDLPVGVVRVLLDDLLGRGLIVVQRPAAQAASPDPSLLKEVIDGLRAL